MWTMNFQMFKLVWEKTEESEIKLPTPAGLSKKQESSRKTAISAVLTMPEPLFKLLCSIRIHWVQCVLIFLIDSFPTSDFDFTCLFNFCTSFFSLYSQACQSAVLIYMPLQQLLHDCMCCIYYSKYFKANKNVKAIPPWELLWQTLTTQWF